MAEELSAKVVKLEQALDKEVKNLNKEVDKAWSYCDDLRRDAQTVAEVVVATGREQQRQRGRSNLVCFTTGEFKDKVKQEWEKFRLKSKEHKANEEAKQEEDEVGGGEEMADERGPPWKVLFWTLLVTWFRDQVKEGGGRAADLKSELGSAVEKLGSLVPECVFDFVKVMDGKGKGKSKGRGGGTAPASASAASAASGTPPPPPPDEGKAAKPLILNLALKGGATGAEAFELLETILRPFYKSKVPGLRKPQFTECSIKADNGGGKDRPLTARVCEIAGIEVRKGKAGGKGPEKRKSPSRGEGERSGSRARTTH